MSLPIDPKLFANPYRFLVEHSGVILTLLDRALDVIIVSPAIQRVLGIQPEHWQGQAFLSFIHPNDRRILWDSLRAAQEHARVPHTVQVRIRHANTTWRTFALQSTFGTSEGEAAFVLTLEDITAVKEQEEEQKRALEAAEAQNENRKRFLARLSHEIRTPLTSILGFTHVLRMDAAGEQRDLLELVEESGRRLLNTLNSVLDLAQFEAQAIDINREVLELGAEIKKSVLLLQPLAQQKSLELRTIVPAEPIPAYLDPDLFGRIINNLVGNAIKFTIEGEVVVQLRVTDDTVELLVKDSGVGIEDDFMPFLFEEFKRAEHRQGRPRVAGSGLGLAITRQIIELMHGTITVESEQGQGSTFTVSFPREVIAPASEQERAQSRRTILVLEPQLETRQIIRHFLQQDYDLVFARSIEDAKAALLQQHIDLFLVAITLSPVAEAKAILADLRAMQPNRMLPAVAILSQPALEQADVFSTDGFNAHLPRPFRRQQLIYVIEKALANAANPTTT